MGAIAGGAIVDAFEGAQSVANEHPHLLIDSIYEKLAEKLSGY